MISNALTCRPGKSQVSAPALAAQWLGAGVRGLGVSRGECWGSRWVPHQKAMGHEIDLP